MMYRQRDSSRQMKVLIQPGEYQKTLELEAGTPLSKTTTFFLWLDNAVVREGGPEPRVPLGLMARANEEVRALFGYECYSAVADLLGTWGFKYDRRNVKNRLAQCSGFPLEDVVFWENREPLRLEDLPPDHKEFLAQMTGTVGL